MAPSKISNSIFIILLFCVLVACGYLIYLLVSENTQCLKNPFIYGASHNIQGEVQCMCSVLDKNKNTHFLFNETDLYAPPEPTQESFILP